MVHREQGQIDCKILKQFKSVKYSLKTHLDQVYSPKESCIRCNFSLLRHLKQWSYTVFHGGKSFGNIRHWQPPFIIYLIACSNIVFSWPSYCPLCNIWLWYLFFVTWIYCSLSVFTYFSVLSSSFLFKTPSKINRKKELFMKCCLIY